MAEPSLLERSYHEIKWRIIYGTYKPGMHLSEGVLTRVHRASRTPIREALSRLFEEGYVERASGRGYAVARVTVGFIHNLFEVRRVLEGKAAAKAVEVATEIAAIRALGRYDFVSGKLPAIATRSRRTWSSTWRSPAPATTCCW